ncbi:NmrA family NAD(P)-binding protein [Paenibacillus terrae]
MRYIVTGVDGQLASRIAETVLAEVGGRELTFTCMNKERIPKDALQRWEQAGVSIFEINYDDIPSMVRAFKDGDRIYIVSGLEVGKRVQQHRNAIDTAIRAGISHITYSSFIGATDPDYAHVYVTPDHTATEQYLKSTGIAYNAVRNNLYLENYLTMYTMLALMSDHKWLSTAGEGRATLVHKDDCARAAAAALLGKAEDNRAYDIVGSESVSVRDLCNLIQEVSGEDMEYIPVDAEQYYKYLEKLHIPREITGDFSRSPVPFCGEDLMTTDASIKEGLLNVKSDAIEVLTGQKPKTARDIVGKYKYIWENHIRSWRDMK